VGNNLTPKIQAYFESKEVDVTNDSTPIEKVILFPEERFLDIYDVLGGTRSKSPLGQLLSGSITNEVLSLAQLRCNKKVRMTGRTSTTTQCDGDGKVKAQVGEGDGKAPLPDFVEFDQDIRAYNGILHRVSGVLIPPFIDLE